MSTLELKEEIHKKVDSITNDAILFEINHRLDLLLESPKIDNFESIDTDEAMNKRLKRAMKSYENGDFITTGELRMKFKEWNKR